MQELLTFVAQSLVEHPEQVVVTETEGPEAVILELHVAEEDMGKVIGKQGRIAKAIRAVVLRDPADPAFFHLSDTGTVVFGFRKKRKNDEAGVFTDWNGAEATGNSRRM